MQSRHSTTRAPGNALPQKRPPCGPARCRYFASGSLRRISGGGRRAFACCGMLLALCCFLILSGCFEFKKVIPPPPPQEQPVPQVEKKPPEAKKPEQPKARQRYTSLEGFSVRTLGRNEAGRLARRISPGQQGLESWNDLKFALEQSLEHTRDKDDDGIAVTYPSRPPVNVTWKELREGLLRMLEILPYLDENPGLLAAEFRWLALSPFLFTGYYEPTISASYRPSPMHSFPLYAKPPDLQSGKLYFDRHSIDRKNILSGRGLELAWVRDEVDAFFLQIQGSGRLVFPDGKTKHVLYAAKNGHPYVSIGAVLRDKGLLEENNISMPSIRSCLLDNPAQKSEILDANPSYVFFSLADEGPVGSMGRILTPQVSLAVDPRVLPYGSLVFFNTSLPNQLGVHNRSIHAISLPQDSGGAIKGRRIDFFMGAGKAAEHIAGHLNQEGNVYVLLPVKGGSFTSQGRQN